MHAVRAIAWILGGVAGIAQAMNGAPVPRSPAMQEPAALVGADVLYEQFEGQEGTAIISQDFPVEGDVLDSQAADDFSVPFGESWQINAIDAAYARGGDGTYAGVGIHVYFFDNGVGGQPGSLVATALSQAYTSGFDSGMETVSIVLASPVTLPAGSYWLSLQADEPYGGYWYWRGHHPQAGQGAMWRNPLDGYSSGCTTWTDLGGCSDIDMDPDLQFRLRGTRGVATHNGVYHSSPLDHALAPTSVGTSLNLVSEALDEAGPLTGDWDLNFWLSDSGTFGFFGLDNWNARFLIDEAGEVAVLHPGDTIGPAATFATFNGPPAAPAWLAGTDAYAGVRFDCNGRLTNPVAAGPCYGYVHLTSSAPAGFPATLIDYAYDGDGQAITIAAPGDAIFCSGFDGGSDGCDGANDEGIYATREQFLANLASGWFDNPFDDVGGGASAALEYDHAGVHYIVNTQSGAASGLFNQPGVISTTNAGDMISIHFSGTPVTAIGGNFWATDSAFAPTGTDIMLYLSDGTIHRFATDGPDAFRGFVSRVPITYLHIDAPDEGAIIAWSTLDNLVVGTAN